MTMIKLSHINLTNFKHKEFLAEFEISFYSGEEQKTIKKEYLLKRPAELVTQLILDVKSKDRIIIDDPSLDPLEKLEKYSPILLKNEEQVEEKIHIFLKGLHEKATKLKNNKSAETHMKLINEFKTANLQLGQ